jgi:hypothetical protein
MSNPSGGPPRATPGGETPALPEDERRFLSDLLDNLMRADHAAHDILLEANPDWVEHYGEADRLRGRIRAALTGQAGTSLSAEQVRLIERTKAAWAEHRAAADRTAPQAAPEETEGILTSLTRHLPPEKAVALYHKIAPAFVYQLLKRLNESASLRVAHQLVDHLCSEGVQQRLRVCAHVRNGILDECRAVLGQSEIRQEISREELQHLLVECGAMHDLIAMENCITLMASKAG